MGGVADRVAHFVVDQVLPVGADVTLERHRPAHPAGQVDEHPGLGVGTVHRVVARGFDFDLVPAALADRHRGGQRDPKVRLGVRGVDALKGELRVVDPALRVRQGLGDHPGKGLVAAERRGVDAVLHLDGVGEHLLAALADLRRGPGNDLPGLLAGHGQRAACGQNAGGQVDVELGQAARWAADDGRADRADGRRALDRFGDRLRDGPGQRLIEHDTGQRHQHRQRVGPPSVGGQEPTQPTLLADLTVLVAVGPGPAGVLGQRVALSAQRLIGFAAQHGRANTPAWPRLIGHRPRIAQRGRRGSPGRAGIGHRARYTRVNGHW